MNEIAPFADRLCMTLLHSLWQATAILLLVSIAVRLSRCGSRAGYAAWMAGLVFAIFFMPVTFLTVSPGLIEPQTPASAMSLSTNEERSSDGRPETTSSTPAVASMQPDTDVAATPSVDSPAVASSVKGNSDEQPVEAAAARSSLIKSTAPWIVAVYAIGVVMMLVRLCFSAANANRLVRTATIQKDDRLDQMVQSISRQWNMRIAPVVAVTQQVIVPHVVGLLRPVILLPASAMTGLSADELSLVLAHEIAHLRRFDLWAAMVQRFAEAVLFFNPAVWLLSRRVSEFREFCCDDLVCQNAATSQKEIGVRYARALLQVMSLSAADRSNNPGLTALAASGRGPSELRRRIARLLNEPLSEPFPAGRSLLILLGACLLWLTLPVLLPTNLSNGPSSSVTLADQVDDKAQQREFRLQINGPDSKPLSNVQCEIRGISKITAADVLVGRHEKDARYGIKLVTNENGQLHFRRPANLDYLNVFVEAPGYGPYLAEWRTADGSDGIPDTFTMELESAWTVTGQVVDESGKPIVGANVSPSVQFRKRPGDERKMGVGTDLTTDADGFWRYEMVPSSKDYVHVSVDYPNYAPSRLSLKRAEYEAKPNVAPKTIALTKGLSVTGTVTEENGNPIEGALVRTKYLNEIREATT
ncbi:MAG: M56 family metallopeptidase, partial [Planctomycetaceae bacterium]